MSDQKSAPAFRWLQGIELRTTPPRRAAAHPTVTARHRRLVVLWMLQASSALGVDMETAHRAVLLLDAFLAADAGDTPELQHLGAVCLYLAWKVDLDLRVDMTQVVEILDDAVTLGDVLRLERRVARAIEYSFLAPTAQTFLPEVLAMLERRAPRKVVRVAGFAAACTLLDAGNERRPSLVAASAVAFALMGAGDAADTDVLEDVQEVTGFLSYDIKETVEYVVELIGDVVSDVESSAIRSCLDCAKKL